jgi:hypothetical protein
MISPAASVSAAFGQNPSRTMQSLVRVVDWLHRASRRPGLLAAVAATAWLSGCAPAANQTEPLVTAPERIWDPALGCDEDGRAYAIALTRDTAGAYGFVFATTDPSGASWTKSDPAPFGLAPRGRRRPRLAIGRPGEVNVLWEDSRSGPVDLYFNRSTDGGTTWLPNDVRVNAVPTGSSRLATPALACDDYGRVFAVWRDDREGFEAYYCNASRDGGASWGPRDVRITSIGMGRKTEPRLVCDRRQNLAIAWIEQRDGGQRAYCNASFDGGETWMAPDVSLGDAGDVFGLDLVLADGGTLVAAFSESGAGGDHIFVTRSTSGGRVWDAVRELRSPELSARTSVPRVTSDERGNVFVAWAAMAHDGNMRIAVAASSDAGRTFDTVSSIVTGQLEDPDPHGPRRGLDAPFDLACDNSGNLYVTWIEFAAGERRVAIDRLGSFGRQWMRLPPPLGLAADVPVSPAPPRIACDDFGHVHLLWSGGHVLFAATSPFYAESGWRRHGL